MRAATGLLLVWRLAAAQDPTRPPTVVVLPKEIRDSMSVIWSASNRDWDWVPPASTPTTMAGASRPTRAYVGCLSGYAAGDTLWVHHLMPAIGVKRRQFTVTGDCSQVADVIGTWHTHPYRAGFEGRAIKERALSGLDFKTFLAAPDVVTMVMWDVDSLDLAIKTPQGGVRHPAPVVIR
jgi:hypothetical protein